MFMQWLQVRKLSKFFLVVKDGYQNDSSTRTGSLNLEDSSQVGSQFATMDLLLDFSKP